MELKFILNDITKLENGFIKKIYFRAVLIKDGKNVDTYDHLHFDINKQDETFIPFEELSEEIVSGWIEDSLGEKKVESLRELLIDKWYRFYSIKEETLNPWKMKEEETRRKTNQTQD